MSTWAIDFETHLISEQEPVPRPVCLSYYNGTNSGLLAGADMAPFLLNLLQDDTSTIVAHNAIFELLTIHEHFPKLRHLLWTKLRAGSFLCTLLKEKLMANISFKPQHKFDLASLVEKYLGEDISDTKSDPDAWRLRYAELDGVKVEYYPKKAAEYAIQDSIYAYKILEIQTEIAYTNVTPHVIAGFALNLMGRQGALVDHNRVVTLKSELLKNMQASLELLDVSGLIQYDKKGKYKKRAKEFRAYVTEMYGDIAPKTAKGTIATGADVLINLQTKKPSEILGAWLDVMQNEKVLSTFVKALEEAKPYIRTEYDPIVSSGRTSSRASKFYPSMNIQQLPRQVKGVTYDVRNCIIPTNGYSICSIDYSGLELAATAHQLKTSGCGDDMSRILNAGDTPMDLHSMLASHIMGIKKRKHISFEEFMARKKEDEFKAFRQLAKPLNLGFPGGIGYDTMRGLLTKEGIIPKLVVVEESPYEDRLIDLMKEMRRRDPSLIELRVRRAEKFKYQLVWDELKQLKLAMLDLYPDLRYFLKHKHEHFLMRQGEDLITKKMQNDFGEWEDEPMYALETMGVKRAYCTYTALCNGYLMQTPSAAGAKAAVTRIIEKYDGDKRVRMLAFIHDEVVFEVINGPQRETIISDIAEILIDEMQKKLYTVRIAVEAEVFDCWKKSGGDWVKSYWKDSRRGDLKCK